MNKYIPYFHKTYGNNIGWSHPSVKRGLWWLRVLQHIFCLRFCLRFSGERAGKFACRLYEIKVGPGAGYVSGLTAYCGLRCINRKERWRRSFLQVGITSNASKVPYAS